MENHQFITIKNSTVFYRVSGQGKTVVLLHGFGEDGNIWNEIEKKLKNNFRIIVPDIPGSGKSGLMKNEKGKMKRSVSDATYELINCVILIHPMQA